MKRLGIFATIICLLGVPSLASAQSAATPVVPGYLTTSGCPAGYTSCFVQYGLNGQTVVINPAKVATTNSTGTITLGGTAQSALAANASRKSWCVQNPETETEVLDVADNGTASSTVGVHVQPGNQVCNLPGLISTAAISVNAATTAHRWLAVEQQ